MAQNALLKRSTARRKDKSESLEKKIMGVPARIMRPRLIMIGTVTALVLFGLIMIYSASSVKALSLTGDSAFYVKRQLICLVLGLGLMAFTSYVDYHTLRNCLFILWLITVGMLLAVWLMGSDANGATRWVEIGPVRLQPSEFAKATIVLAAANLASEFYGGGNIDPGSFMLQIVVYIAAPMLLIFMQPDNGTVIIIMVMLFAILYNSGFPRDLLIKMAFAVFIVGLIVILTIPYARQRVFNVFDTSSDYYGDNYQINQGFIAFGSGGLFGVGLGMSRQKYFYLPEAHNDFIFAIIGEEFGLLGTLLVIFAFALLLYEAIKIAQNAPDLLGQLIVIGCITLLITQMFVNIMGVLGMMPMSGKTLPFISYGGSSIMSCLMLVGLMINVSMRSTLPETVYDQRRSNLALAEEDTGVGEAHVRSSAASTGRSTQLATPRPRPTAASSGQATKLSSPTERRGNLSVVEGGGGYERINLGPNPSDRLRSGSSNGPTINTSGKGARGGSSRSGRGKRG